MRGKEDMGATLRPTLRGVSPKSRRATLSSGDSPLDKSHRRCFRLRRYMNLRSVIMAVLIMILPESGRRRVAE